MKATGSEKGKCSKVTSQGTPVTTCLRPPVLEPTLPARATDVERKGAELATSKGLVLWPQTGETPRQTECGFPPPFCVFNSFVFKACKSYP